MAREYIKLPNGTLQEIDRARVREFASVDCVKKAIADGDLQPGDAWATICHTTVITEDIASEVYRVLSYIPETTNSTDNKLLNHCDLTTEMEEIAKRAMCCDFQEYVETAGVAITDRVCCSDYNTCVGNMQGAIDARVSCTDYNAYTAANDVCMSCRVQCCDFTAFQTSNTAAINTKVTCTDYNTCVGNMQSAITTLEGKPGISCIGTVTSITLNGLSYTPTSGVISLPNYPPDLSSCPGLLCQGTVVASDIASFITMADVNACNYTTMTAVNACGFTTCLGTVVASDLTPINTAIGNLESCPGLSCQGTVVASDLTPLSTAITTLEGKPGLDCTGTLTASDISDMATQTWVNNCGFSKATFSLSGNVLTITTA